jgi:UDP-N-acetylmuramoyl-tripeptide--D-alanyl-D-alanine ligase
VAITGSNGKTTTRRMAAAVAATRFNILTTRGNLNNEIGVPLTLFDLARSHQAAVLELGMNHPGEIDRLGAICLPTIGLITNVGPAHLEFLGSLAGVAQAKAELIGHVDANGALILNGDDPLVAEMARKAGHRRVIFFGVNDQAHVRADAIRDAGQGTAFDLLIADQGAGIRLPARGRFMVSNALAAAAAGTALGIGIEEIKAALEAYQPLQGRMAITRFADGSAVIDDTYNANPASMQAAIETLASLKADQPGVIVVGDMLELGGEAADLHHSLGRQAAAGGVLRLYACGRHAGDVARGAVEAGMNAAMIVTGTKEEITDQVIRHLSSGTWVLVKGSRGMAMESIVRALIDHFLHAAQENEH